MFCYIPQLYLASFPFGPTSLDVKEACTACLRFQKQADTAIMIRMEHFFVFNSGSLKLAAESTVCEVAM